MGGKGGPPGYSPWSVPQEHVPPRLCTSPMPCGDLSGFPPDSQLSTASEPEAITEGVPSTGRKKRLRRRKPRQKEDTVAANSSSEELETGAESELSLPEKPRPEPPGCVRTRWGAKGVGIPSRVQAPFLLPMLCDPGQGP